MSLSEKLFPLTNGKVLALLTFSTRFLDSESVDRVPASQGYAYLFDPHTRTREDLLPLCTHTRLSKGAQQAGIACPVDAQIAPNGIARLIFAIESGKAPSNPLALFMPAMAQKLCPTYLSRTVDLLQGTILAEAPMSPNETQWLALNEAGTQGVWRQFNAPPPPSPAVQAMNTQMMALMEMTQQMLNNPTAAKDIAPEILEQKLEALLNPLLSANPQSLMQPPAQPNLPQFNITNLENGRLLGTIHQQVNAICAYGSQQWLSYSQGNIGEKNATLTLHDAQGKPLQHYPVKNNNFPSILEGNPATGRCQILLDNTIYLIDLASGHQTTFRPHIGLHSTECIYSSRWNRSGTWLATLASSNEIVITRTDTAQPVSTLFKTFENPNKTRADICFIGDTLILLAGGECQVLGNPSDFEAWQKTAPKPAEPVDNKIPFTRPPSAEILKETLFNIGLGRVATQLLEFYAPMITCKPLPASTPKQPGLSHFGGHPDLAAPSLWPTWQNRPMRFIGQFNLADIAAKIPDNDLPKTGLLSLFIGVDEDGIEPYVTDYDERIRGNEWKVLYQKDLQALRTIPTPANDYERDGLPYRAITFAPLYCLPEDDSILIETLRLTREETEAYQALIARINLKDEEDVPLSETIALRGHPLGLENNTLEIHCEASRQLGSYYDYEETEALRQDAKELRQLFQLMDQDQLNLDIEFLYYYFFISKTDLQNENFDRVWFYIESHH